MLRFAALLYLTATTRGVTAFVSQQPKFSIGTPHADIFPQSTSIPLHSKKDGDDAVQHAFPVGAFVEFQEKKRIHVGKISSVEHKSSGGARYDIIDSEGKKYNIPDKAVLYSMPCPNSPGQATKLFNEFAQAQDAPLATLQEELDISPELLYMAWEETASEEEGDHLMTGGSLIELVHSHSASAMEKYLAWKLLKTEMARIFFKEIKDHGRVVAFKAKAEKSVEAAKQLFCKTHEDAEICFV